MPESTDLTSDVACAIVDHYSRAALSRLGACCDEHGAAAALQAVSGRFHALFSAVLIDGQSRTCATAALLLAGEASALAVSLGVKVDEEKLREVFAGRGAAH